MVADNSRNVQMAKENRKERIKALIARDRLLPSLQEYDSIINKLSSNGEKSPYRAGLNYLTDIFRSTYDVVKQQIKDSGKEGIQQINAVKRSAGTNYQGLVEYAIIKWIDTTSLPLNVGPNAPKSMKKELTIYGVDEGGDFQVEPDIDICLYEEGGKDNSPLMFISAKTSLVDRAGQAARWKLYLDLHQTTCPHRSQVLDCPIHKTMIKINTSHPITHCIVTANIYKIDTTQPEGELKSGQCKNNTYMFRHKYTTRNDSLEYKPKGWNSFSMITDLINTTYR